MAFSDARKMFIQQASVQLMPATLNRVAVLSGAKVSANDVRVTAAREAILSANALFDAFKEAGIVNE